MVERKICVGQFAGAHGVRGLMKLRSFTGEPEAIFDYAPLATEDGRVFKIAFKSAAKDYFLIEIDGIANKEEADALRGDRLYISRAKLPKTAKDEYYEAELIGLAVVGKAGHTYGRVLGVHDHGAGVFLEIGQSKKDSFMLPFRDAFVPEVDVKTGKVVVVIPDGWIE